MTFSISIPTKPLAKGRPRFANGIVYTPKETRSKEAEIRWHLTKANAPMFEGPICLSLTFYFLRPKSAKKRIYPCVRPDLDNLAKTIKDAANGILWRDDCQICWLRAKKLYGDQERIEITVIEAARKVV